MVDSFCFSSSVIVAILCLSQVYICPLDPPLFSLKLPLQKEYYDKKILSVSNDLL